MVLINTDNSYQNIDETTNNVDNNIVMFSEDINTNKNKLNDIENQLSLNQKSIEQIKDILIENDQLAKSSNNKKEIESISILLTQLKNEIDELKIDLKKNDNVTNVYSDNKFENESLINLIKQFITSLWLGFDSKLASCSKPGTVFIH